MTSRDDLAERLSVASATPLARRDLPAVPIQQEQAWHRSAIHMLLAGHTAKDVALTLGKSPQAVTFLKSQPWFSRVCGEIAAQRAEELGIGKDAMQIMLEASSAAALNIISIAASPKASDQTRLKASELILDRAFGKASQPITDARPKPTTDPQAEIERLRKSIEKLSEKLPAHVAPASI